MHLDCALGVPDVVHFLLSLASDVAECSRNIIIRHILKSKLPELGIFLGIVLGVVKGVFVASAVAQHTSYPLLARMNPGALGSSLISQVSELSSNPCCR